MIKKNNGIKTFKLEDFSPLPDFPLWLSSDHRKNDYPVHCHDFTELVIVSESRGGIHFTQEDSYQLETGDVFVIPEKVPHGYKNIDSVKIENIIFKLEELELPFRSLYSLPAYQALFQVEPALRTEHKFKSRLRVTKNALTNICKLIEKLRLELDNGNIGFEAASISIFTELLITIFRELNLPPAPEPVIVNNISKVLSFMEKYFSRKITLRELAETACMSERNFQRYFKNTMHVSPIDYLIRLRVKKALEMLSIHGKTVSQSAFDCGFADSSYFSLQFRKILGRNPASFIKKSPRS